MSKHVKLNTDHHHHHILINILQHLSWEPTFQWIERITAQVICIHDKQHQPKKMTMNTVAEQSTD